MSTPASWQMPASDDISPDALEYLFAREKMRRLESPWLRVVDLPAEEHLSSPQLIQLSTGAQVLSAQLECVSRQLQAAYMELGFLKAELAERDHQLSLLKQSDWQQPVAHESVQLRKLKRRVVWLEEIIAGSEIKDVDSAGQLACRPHTPDLSEELAADIPDDQKDDLRFRQYRSCVPEQVSVKLLQPQASLGYNIWLLPLSCVLIASFVWGVLLMLFS